MGNWHCVKSDCATVVYREYLPPVVRYRYKDEDWQEVIGHSYSISDNKSKYDFLERKNYKIYAKAIVSARVPPENSGQPPKFIEGQEIEVLVSAYFSAPIYDVVPVVNGKNINANVTYTEGTGGNQQYTFCEKVTQEWTLFTQTSRGNVRIKKDGGSYYEPPIDLNIGLYDFRFEKVGDAKPCKDEIEQNCIFRVFRGSEEKGLTAVLEINRDTCPEVEQLPCRLSDIYKEIKIEKFPYLERIEVVPYAYQNFGFGVYQAIIPDECLNIYKNKTTTIIPQFEGLPTPTNTAQSIYRFIAQISSAVGCPRPEYEVICNCDEKCPPGTCEVRCGDHLCCYDVTTGKSVKQIPIASFFPTNTKGGNSR